MRKLWVVTGVVALCSLGALALPADRQLVADLKASRDRVPPVAAVYLESVRVPSDQKQQQKRTDRAVISWGDHDTDWTYQFAFGTHASFRDMIGDEKSPLSKTFEQKDFCSGDDYYRWVSYGAQGAIAKRKPGYINPLGVGYEMRMGEPIADYIESIGASDSTNDQVTVVDKSQQANFHFVRFGQQVCADDIQFTSPGFSEHVIVKDWFLYKGWQFPKSVESVRQKDGKEIQTITYSLVKLLPKPEFYLTWHGWHENAIVKDNATQLVYRYQGGKLVLDQSFNRRASAWETTYRAVLLLLGLLAAWWVTVKIGKLRARRVV